jgi:Ca-activated chloride channel family protein
MNFEYPQFLFLLPLVLALGIYAFRITKQTSSRIRLFLMLGSVSCLILAGANPYWSTMPLPVISKETNVVIILDVSQSMFCGEGGATRLDQATKWIKTLLPQFSGSSIALIYFAGDAQIGSPFTQDPGAVRLFLNSTAPNMTGMAGTKAEPLQAVLAETLSTEGNLEEGRRKQIGLLFSDGEFFDSAGKLEQWLNANPAFTLFTFACGRARAAVPKFDLSGPYPNAFSEAQTKPLQALASAGGGRFFNLAESSNDDKIAKELTTGIRELVSQGHAVPRYQFLPFSVASLLLILGFQIVPLIASLRRGAAIRFAALILTTGLISLGMSGAAEKQATFAHALEALKQKQFQKAIDQLQKLKQEGATEEVDVALGNAYFEQGSYDQAILHYRNALTTNPQNQRARWNWEVALKRKSQPGPQPPPPPPSAKPPELPRESQALLKYSDEMEQDQMKALNTQNAKPPEFAW